MRRFDLHYGDKPDTAFHLSRPAEDSAAMAHAAANAGLLLGFVLGVAVALFAVWAF